MASSQSLNGIQTIAIASLFGGVIAYISFAYLMFPSFIDHGEPINSILGYWSLSGLPIYHSFDEPQITTNVYGPLFYGLLATSFGAFGPEIISAKTPSVAALFFTPYILAFAFRHSGWLPTIFGLTLSYGLIILAFPFAILVRPDALVLLAITLGVLLTHLPSLRRRPACLCIILGILIGFSIGLKLYAFIAFFPSFVVALLRYRGRGLALIIVGTVALSAIGFALPYASFEGFLAWFGVLIADKPAGASVLEKVIRYAALYTAPILLFLARFGLNWPKKPEDFAFVAAYVCSLLVIMVPAAKGGAGAHYLLALVPAAASILVRSMEGCSLRSLVGLSAAILVCVSTALSLPPAKRFFRAMDAEIPKLATRDLQTIVDTFPDARIHMGWGDTFTNYGTTFVRPKLVLNKHPYFVDPAIAMEFAHLKLGNALGLIARLEVCEADIWIIPKDEKPFGMTSFYTGTIMDSAFQATFLATYEKQASYDVFDAWICRTR